jgi:hypothetical protein
MIRLAAAVMTAVVDTAAIMPCAASVAAVTL